MFTGYFNSDSDGQQRSSYGSAGALLFPAFQPAGRFVSALRDVYPYCIWEELVIPTRASGGDDGYCDATPWQPQGSGIHREGHCHVVFMQSGNVMLGDWFSLQPD